MKKQIYNKYPELFLAIILCIFIFIGMGCEQHSPEVEEIFNTLLDKITPSVVTNQKMIQEHPELLTKKHISQIQNRAITSKSPVQAATAIQIISMIKNNKAQDALKKIVTETNQPVSWYSAVNIGLGPFSGNKTYFENFVNVKMPYSEIVTGLAPLRWEGDAQTIEKLESLKSSLSNQEMTAYINETIQAIQRRLKLSRDTSKAEALVQMEKKFWSLLLYPRMLRGRTQSQLIAAKDISASGSFSIKYLNSLMGVTLHDAQMVAILIMGLQYETSQIPRLQSLAEKSKSVQLKKVSRLALDQIALTKQRIDRLNEKKGR